MTNIFTKDPDAVLDFAWDWSQWLEDGETISSYAVTVPSGITKDSDSNTDTTVTAFLSGGTADTGYAIVCQITTSAGRTDDRSIYINVRER